MNLKSHREKCERFHQLHHNEIPLLLPNAWDALSAKLLAQAGAQAIATTSAGMAAVLGYPDGQALPKKLFLEACERIIQAVTIPVSIDMEAGYGKTIAEVCDTVQQLLQMGAVGCNIEDADLDQPNQLIEIAAQVEKIAALKTLIRQTEIPFFLNARTDAYWLNHLSEAERYPETLKRLRAYQAAGADGVFVPGLQDEAVIAKLTQEIKLPLNVLGGSWIKSWDQLKRCQVARVSLGSSLVRASATYLQTVIDEVLHNTNFSVLNSSISYTDFNQLFETVR